jgi:hypothetical protein
VEAEHGGSGAITLFRDRMAKFGARTAETSFSSQLTFSGSQIHQKLLGKSQRYQIGQQVHAHGV